MHTISSANKFKSSANSSMTIKKILLGVTLALTCLNPSLALAQYNYETEQLVQRQQDYKIQADKLQTEMGLYILANLQPSTALLASGVGIAAVLEENLDPVTKAALLLAGAVGGSYCLDSANLQYCAEVAANLTAYAVKIDNYNRQIDLVSQQIRSLQQ